MAGEGGWQQVEAWLQPGVGQARVQGPLQPCCGWEGGLEGLLRVGAEELLSAPWTEAGWGKGWRAGPGWGWSRGVRRATWGTGARAALQPAAQQPCHPCYPASGWAWCAQGPAGMGAGWRLLLPLLLAWGLSAQVRGVQLPTGGWACCWGRETWQASAGALAHCAAWWLLLLLSLGPLAWLPAACPSLTRCAGAWEAAPAAAPPAAGGQPRHSGGTQSL